MYLEIDERLSRECRLMESGVKEKGEQHRRGELHV